MGVCRLCLSRINGKGIYNPDILDALQAFMPEMTRSLVREPVICEICLDNINVAYTLLQHKIDSDIKIQEQLDTLGVSQIDLTSLYENGCTSETNVCRICLKMINGNNGVCLYETNNNRIQHDLVANMFQVCNIPVNLEVSDKPFMCSECWKLLEATYTFKNNFIQTEIKIKRYCQFANFSTPLNAEQLNEIGDPGVEDDGGHLNVRKRRKTEHRSSTSRQSSESDESTRTASSCDIGKNSEHTVEFIEEDDHMSEPDDVFNEEEEHYSMTSHPSKNEVKHPIKPINTVENSPLITGKLSSKSKTDTVNEQVYYPILKMLLLGGEYDVELNQQVRASKLRNLEENFNLVKIYYQANVNKESEKLGNILMEVQQKWLSIYPESEIPVRDLVKRARSILRRNLLPKEITKAFEDDAAVRNDHSYDLSIFDTSEEIAKINIDLVRIYLEVTNNQTEFENGYYDKLQERWLELYPTHLISGQHLSNYAHHFLSFKLIPADALKEIELEIFSRMSVDKICLELTSNVLSHEDVVSGLKKAAHAKPSVEKINKYCILVSLYLDITKNETCFGDRLWGQLESAWLERFPDEKITGEQLYKMACYIFKAELLPKKELRMIRNCYAAKYPAKTVEVQLLVESLRSTKQLNNEAICPGTSIEPPVLNKQQNNSNAKRSNCSNQSSKSKKQNSVIGGNGNSLSILKKAEKKPETNSNSSNKPILQGQSGVSSSIIVKQKRQSQPKRKRSSPSVTDSNKKEGNTQLQFVIIHSCKACNFETDSLELYTRHTALHNLGVTCVLCHEFINGKSEMEEHLKVAHRDGFDIEPNIIWSI